jgi:hypothetical protein
MKGTWRIGALALVVGFISGPAHAQDQAAVNAAIDRGVAALKKLQQPDGTWLCQIGPPWERDIGCTALVGMALLDSGVPANDPAIAQALKVITREAPTLTQTYPIATTILFLRRYGDMVGNWELFGDLIKSLGMKLLREQSSDGGWSHGGKANAPSSDNSNTQFVILGLWMARNHGVRVVSALASAELRFYRTQDAGGGWSYGNGNVPDGNTPTPAMTRAGVIGLYPAVPAPHESRVALRDDPAVRRALSFLAKAMREDPRGKQDWMYFLWSLERMCVAYELRAVGQVDWYEWGLRALLSSQQKDGTWKADHGLATDTAFALLFLKRATVCFAPQ